MGETTSGRKCSPSELPAEAKKLSWGAFWFSWIWGLFNGTYISLLAIFPLPGIMNVVLLFKGRQWAWENKKWDDEKQFDRAQRAWGRWGLFIVLLPVIIGVFIFVPVYFSQMMDTKNGSTKTEYIDNDTQMLNELKKLNEGMKK
jgi:hypothetical protein